MSLKRCKFCSMDFRGYESSDAYKRIDSIYFRQTTFLFLLNVFWISVAGPFRLVFMIFFDNKNYTMDFFCESCSDLDLKLKTYEEYGQVWDVKKVLENSHLNPAQQKVYLKYGLIDPREAVERIKLDNTWQDSDYPTLTLEDLNYRHLSLFQQIPTGFYLFLSIILGLMILNDSWFFKFLGISGIGGIFYFLYQSDQNTQIRAERWMPPEED